MAKEEFRSRRPGVNNNSNGELRKRLLFVVFALIVFRIGSHIPVPGVNASILAEFVASQSGSTIDFWNTFSGGALSRASILALGILPYISASIVVQLLSNFLPSLQELKKEGEAGRKAINKLTRYFTLFLSSIQAIIISSSLPNLVPGLVSDPGLMFKISASISLVVGSMFLMWIGEQITERGIGNGISLIVFGGIVSGLPGAIATTIEQTRTGQLSIISLFVLTVSILAIVAAIVFVERGQRRIAVNYAAQRQVGRAQTPQHSILPFKVNMAGVIPAIFASSILAFVATGLQWLGAENDTAGYLANVLSAGQPAYMIIMSSLIVFFAFFYTAMQYNPNETADQLKRSGAYIPGVRPGEATAKLLDRIITRITLIGGLYVALVALIPEFARNIFNFNFAFGGLSVLIVVVVIMDFVAQVQSYLMSSKYGKSLEKANLKGYSSSWAG